MFIDAFKISDKKNTYVAVIEKTEKGERIAKIFGGKDIFYFYYENSNGMHKTLDNKQATKISFKTKANMLAKLKELRKEKIRTYESDIDEVNKVLLNFYNNCKMPRLNVGYFDIEVEIDKEKGFAPPSNPFSKIIAFSICFNMTDDIVTIVLRPPTLTDEDLEKINEKYENALIHFVDDEEELFEAFFNLIEPLDVITGWNTGGYDIPYMINRINRLKIEGKCKNIDISDFCFIPDKLKSYKKQLVPKLRTFEKFGTVHETYDLYGRVHIDYLLLYRKHLGKEMDTLALDDVAERELGQKKVEYEGNLYDLYLNNLEKFIEYSRQDVRLVKLLDEKKKYIDLCNYIAHENCVPISKTLGSIAVIEQALIKLAHDENLGVIPDKEEDEENLEKVNENDGETNIDEGTAGAFVVEQKKGLHEYVCLVDINSLYPSTIRSLNLSPETIYGQLEPTHTFSYIKHRVKNSKRKTNYNEVMRDLFTSLEYIEVMRQSDKLIKIKTDDGKEIEKPAKEIYQFIKENDLAITANGTLIRLDRKGLIPLLLERWYERRKQYKALAKIFDQLAGEGIKIK